MRQVIKSRYLKFFVGISFSAVFLYVVFKSVSLNKLEFILKSTHFSYVFLGIVVLGVAYALRIKRSQSMLSFFNPDILFLTASVPYMVSIAVNNVLPFRVGDVMRVMSFSGWLNVKRTRIITIVMLERLLDFLVVVLFLIVAIMFSGTKNGHSSLLSLFDIFIFLSIVVFVFIFIMYAQVVSVFVNRIMSILVRILPRLHSVLDVHVHNALEALSLMTGRSHVLYLLSLSVLSWFLEACAFVMAALAVPEMSEPLAGWLAMPMGTLATALPSAPGYVGTFHYFVELAAKTLGNSIPASVGFAILIHLMLWLPVTICGTIFFVYWMVRQPDRTENSKYIGDIK